MSTKTNVGGRLETRTNFIKDLISDIQKGEVKIPQFQRRFVWKEAQALELLDSIANNYPVGSLLLWRTHTKLAVERNIGDFKLPTTDDHSPTDYVLDGQQRITVIYSCLGAPAEEPGFAAAYDLETEEFMQGPVSKSSTAFPMRMLFNTTQLLNFRTGLQVQTKASDYQQRLDELVEAFTGYRLPVVVLKELSVEEVCPIFERINSAGTKLSMFDLMVAATWTPTFDLNDIAAKTAASLESKGFEKIEQTTILKCLAAVQFDGFKKHQLLGLRDVKAPDLQALVADTQAALLRTVDLLHTEFRIHSWDFLPYEAILVILCYVCAKVGTLNNNHILKLRQWFWRSALNERYRVGGENFVTRDLEKVLSFVLSAQPPDEFGDPLKPDQILQTTFRSNNSRSRAVILAWAMANPRNLTNGAAIDTSTALSQFNRKQFHHIFPQAYLRRTREDLDSNTIANICMLAASENNSVSDEDPHVYIPQMILAHKVDAATILDSNYMPNPADFDYVNASYRDFVEARSKILAAVLAERCSGAVTKASPAG